MAKNEDSFVTLQQLIDEIGFSVLFLPKDANEMIIESNDVDRPGLEFVGHLKYFDSTRLLFFGMTEMSFLQNHKDEERKMLEPIFKSAPPAVIICRGLDPSETFTSLAKEYGVAILTTSNSTSEAAAATIGYLNVELAPKITRHGVLVEVYGQGCLLIGDSGVGKSETAIELIKRGHRLIADDAVEIKRVSQKTLVGTSPSNIRYFIELRGIGIINARRIFGMGAIKDSEKIDLVINLEQWDSSKFYDRMGMEEEYMEILGVDVPVVTIPVRPGRNLAVIIEVAAMNYRQKKMGYNGAKELLQNLGMDIDEEVITKKEIKTGW